MKYILSVIILTILPGCIHDYPVNGGVDPTMVEAGLEVTFNIKWKEKEETIDLDTRATEEKAYRMIMAIVRNGKIVGQDEVYLTEREFAAGVVKHKLSFGLNAIEYEVGVWLDVVDPLSHSPYAYDTSDIFSISMNGSTAVLDERELCSFACSSLDLREFRNKWNMKVLKEIELSFPCCAFEIVTTDIESFLESQEEALNKGESYTVSLTYSKDTADGFNIFTGKSIRSGESRTVTSPLMLPFGFYSELTIAGGFVLCAEEEIIQLSLSVHNSARQLIIKTPEFSFTGRRGVLTRLKGEFLSRPFSNSVVVDNVWEDDIYIDL